MAYLLLTTFVALTCMFPATQGLSCEPSTRYPHPLNCSMFIMCDEGRNPNTFSCPDGLHFNAKKSYCDWPTNARCAPENEETPKDESTEGENSSINVTDVGKGNVINFLNTMQRIVENMHGNDHKGNYSYSSEDSVSTTEYSEDNISEVISSSLNNSRANEEPLVTEGTNEDTSESGSGDGTKTESTEEDADNHENIKEDNNGSEGLKTGAELSEEKVKVMTTSEGSHTDENINTPEIKANVDLIETKETVPADKIHSIARWQREAETEHEIKKADEKEISGEKVKYENESKDKEEKSEMHETHKDTSDDDLSFNKKSEYNQTLGEGGFSPETNTTGSSSGSEEYLELIDIKNRSAIQVPYVHVPLNLPVDNLNEYLGYQINSSDNETVTSEIAPTNYSEVITTVKEPDTEIVGKNSDSVIKDLASAER